MIRGYFPHDASNLSKKITEIIKNTHNFINKNNNTMNNLTTKFGLFLFAFLLLQGCDQLKSEDDKIIDALLGKYYQEDEVDDEGTKTKDVKGEFFVDGEFTTQATIEVIDEETYETIDLQVKIAGEYKVKDKFIYYTYDFEKLKIKPDYYMAMKDEFVKSIKNKNSPDKVIDYDASKVIYEDSDGKRRTMKKSY